jgi:hypothetical protein
MLSRLAHCTLVFALLAFASFVSSTTVHDVAPLARRGEHSRMIKVYALPERRGLGDLFPGNGDGAKAATPPDSGTGAAQGGSGAAGVSSGASAASSAAAASTTSAQGSTPSTGASTGGTGTGGTGTGGAGTGGTGTGGTGTGDGTGQTGSGAQNPNGGGAGSGGLLGGVGSILGGSSSGSSDSASSTSSTSASSTASANTNSKSTTVSTPASASSPPPISVGDVSTSSTPTPSTSDTPAPSPTDESQQTTPSPSPSSGGISKQTIIILVVVGSCIVGAGLIWTIVRKWKFRPSRDFEGRLAPIDWHPSRPSNDMTERQRRGQSIGSQLSGVPSSDHASIRRNVFAPDAPSLAPDFPPAHDFTAGYARGPSPQPLGRGLSGNRGGYGGRGY